MRREEFYTRVLSEVRRIPGVSNAAYISYLPMTMRGGIWPVLMGGQAPGTSAVFSTRSEAQVASLRYVTPGFFDTLGIPLLKGRDVSEADTADRPAVAVVSASFVRRYWPDQDPIGRHFTFVFQDRTTVGIVGDVRVRGLERNSEPQVYLSYKQVPDNSIIGYTPKDLAVRSSMATASLLPALRGIIRRADPEQPISNVRMMADVIEAETASRTAQARVLGGFAAIALLLAGIGIHGVLSFAISQRSQEIGVRIALGAQRRDILAMVVRQGVRLAIAGVLPGLVLAYLSGRAMEALLAGVKPSDPITFSIVLGLAVVMTTAGMLLPTLRAVRVDPIKAIRTE